jgi:hypothetical protein
VEPESADLIEKMRKHGRQIVVAAAGSEEERYLNYMAAEASVNSPKSTHMLVKTDVGKSTLLEEFLHGTQHRLGLVPDSYVAGLNMPMVKAEYHVKDFMVRHHRLLGLDSSDVDMLCILRDKEKLKIESYGHELPNAHKRRLHAGERNHHPGRKPRSRKGNAYPR